MDRVIEIEAESVEKAVQIALEELGASYDEVEIEVLRETTKSFLGFDKKNAKARVTVKDKRTIRATKLLVDVVERFGLKANITSTEDEDRLHFNIEGEGLGILIGHWGTTLHALQSIVAIVVNKGEPLKKRVVLDIEGYRLRTEKSLAKLAEAMSEKAIKENRNISLRPMSAYERKIIHEALQDNPSVETVSEGEDLERRVIIKPTNNKDLEQTLI
ncbi:MAG TPA: KH domain-containing protein [Actinobacteria bacterium]|nr:KH domain-containing protein [Actinomycetota bacterium]